jgi:hypothetical protein
MSFHKKIEEQLAQEFSPKEETILIDYQDAVFYGRRLQALEMGRLIALAWQAVVSGLKGLSQVSYRQNTDSLPNYLRQDVGLGPISGEVNTTASRGYI